VRVAEGNSMKTILYLVTQSELGGAQRYVFDLAKNLGKEFNIVIAFGEQGEAGELAKKLKRENIKYYTIPHLKRAISPVSDLLALLQIIKLIKKVKPDIIHLNSSKISILGSIAAFLSKSKIENRLPARPLAWQAGKSKIFYTVHGWVFNEPLPLWKKLFYKYAEKFTSIFKDRIICVSEFDYQVATREKICSPKKLITIHNGLAPVNFLSRNKAKQKLQSKFKIQNSKFLIASIANLYPTKGLEYLIQAIHILKEKFLLLTSYSGRVPHPRAGFLLIVIGEGPKRKNLEKLIKQYNLQNNIILAGRIDNAAQLLLAFDVYVCPSVKEGLSYTLIEAMQAGLPIIATNVGGNPELIKNNETGLLVEPKNPEQIAEKIKKLIADQNLQQELSARSRAKAQTEFNLEKMIEKTKNIYF